MHTYNMSSAELKTLKNYINNSLVKKWIHEFQNSADVFIFFIFKKSSKLHFCMNYYKLNVIIIKNYYSLSLINKLFDWINSSNMLLKIDLLNIYHKIHIQENNEWKIIFHMQYKHFKYQVVSFDLINVSAIFQVYINHVLYDLVDNFCIVYFNDILVFSKFKEKHYQHLQLVIKHLHCTELYVNSKKCKFFKIEVKYLDFLVNKKNLYMNSFHIKTVFE